MSILEHPRIGSILTCNFDQGFVVPEMTKRRPVIVLSPKISVRAKLCTVVALSTSTPRPVMPYHCRIEVDPPLPHPWSADSMWVKGDMVNAVGFHRLDLIRTGKDRTGKRTYRLEPIDEEQLRAVRACVLAALGMASLKVHLF